MAADQDWLPPKRPRGRPRKWPSEAARREHEAAKRRLRGKVGIAADEFNDVRRLTALAGDLQRQVDSLQREIVRLRAHERDLQRRLADATGSRRPGLPAAVLPATSEAAPALSRQQRRAAERAQKRAREPQTPAALMPLQPRDLGRGVNVPET